jgi:hypothetical protein
MPEMCRFYGVLASFVLVVGTYHRRSASRPALRHTRTRVVQRLAGLGVVLGISLWVAYQLAPTILAGLLSARAAEYAVRIERGVATTCAMA